MRKLVVVWLGMLAAGCGGEKATDEWVGQLKDSDAARRLEAVRELGRRGPAAEVVSALAAALKDREGYVRRDAAAELGRLGVGARAAVPALLAAKKDRERSVRKAAAKALEQIDPGAALAGER